MLKDSDIRKKFITENSNLLSQGIFINEYSLEGKSRVDFCLFKGGNFYGYEIKSEADNLKRFISQMRTYILYFDYIYLIIAYNHLEDTRSLLNKFKLNRVGLISVSKDNSFRIELEPSLNNSISRLGSFLRNLKKDDLIYLLDLKKIKYDKYYKDYLVSKLIGKVTLSEVLSIFNKRLQAYESTCPNCSSKLVYNTCTVKSKEFNNGKVKCKVTKCFICDNEFNFREFKEV